MDNSYPVGISGNQHDIYEADWSACKTLGSFVEIPNEISPPLQTTTTTTTMPSLQSNSSFTNGLHSYMGENSSERIPQFPDIEKCIPRWKQIFPWVCWCSEDNVLYCLHCRELLRNAFPDKIKKSNVVSVTSSDKIFTVAGTLRNHHNSASHTASIYIYSHSNLGSFVSLLNNHYKDMKQENDGLEAIRSIFNYSELNKEGFIMTIKNIGVFIENSVVESLKESKYFSVVVDQCRGILILRWINREGQIVEHVFWSYLSEWTMTPMQYLKKFGLDFDKMALYIANSQCQQCSRCQNLSVMPVSVSLPPRPPSTLSFGNMLWNLDFLRPLLSLVNTIYKLFKAYPYKVPKEFHLTDLRALFSFNIEPIILIKIMDNFDAVKKMAVEIYESRSYVEALSLAMVELKNDEHHKKIVILLQEIIDTVKEATVGTKITEQQIVKLNQAFGSLKTWSSGANFITYENQNPVQEEIGSKSDKIWEFLYFVEKFIDENQKSIYYKGRDRVRSFVNLCSSKLLLDASGEQVNEGKLFQNFNTVFDVYTQVLKTTHTFDKMRIYKCMKNFHNYLIQNKLPADTCVDIMRMFHNDKNLERRFPDAHEIFSFCGTMPFQPCQIARSLFVSFVIEQRMESSVWTRMGSDLKPWLLYLQHELSFIPPMDLLTWWLQSLT